LLIGFFALSLLVPALVAAVPTVAGASPEPTPKTTVLTVHATDGLDAPAICLDNTFKSDAGNPVFAVCLQASDSRGGSQFRFGYLNMGGDSNDANVMTFSPWNGDYTAQTFNAQLTKRIDVITPPSSPSPWACANLGGHEFTGIGPFTLSDGTWYFGEVFTQGGSDPIGYAAKWHKDTGNCAQLSNAHHMTVDGNGNLVEWSSLYPKSCTPTTVFPDPSDHGVTALENAIGSASNGSPTVCVGRGEYDLMLDNVNLKNSITSATPPVSLEVIGADPFQRPVINASGLTEHPDNSSYASAIVSGGANNVDLYNLIVENTPREPAAGTRDPGAGFGIFAGTNFGIYNVLADNNAVDGINAGSFTLQNSALTNNGDLADNGSGGNQSTATAGGAKTNFAYQATWNVVDNNIGVGLWCDGSPTQTGCRTDYVNQLDVEDNFVGSSGSGGIRLEISDIPAVISSNSVQNSATNPPDSVTLHADIEIVDSQGPSLTNNIDVEHNTFFDSNPPTANTQGFLIAHDSRSGTNYTPKNITFQNNTMNGDSRVCPGNGTNGISCQ
jgi:hypothetical protein